MTFWEEIYGCVKQYRCALDFYFTTNMFFIFKIIIDGEIFDPCHGKYVVYGLDKFMKGIWGNKWIDYQKLLPQLVKALGFFIMPLINQMIVLQNNTNIFYQKLPVLQLKLDIPK